MEEVWPMSDPAGVPEGVTVEWVWLVEVPYTSEAPARRPAHRPVHLERIARLKREGRIIEAGGCDDWSKAVILMRAESADEALAVIAEDVYTSSGVWHSPTARRYGRVVLEEAPGGA
jgi:uncharacterized protein YciI